MIKIRPFHIAATALVPVLLASVSLVKGDMIIEEELVGAFEETGAHELLPVTIIMRNQANSEDLLSRMTGRSREFRRRGVRDELKGMSRAAQERLLKYLSGMESAGKAADITSFWIVNAVSARITRDLALELSCRDDISWIGYDQKVYALTGFAYGSRESASASGRDAIADAGGVPAVAASDTAWGVKWINAPASWKAGYRGRGAIVAIIDTGIWHDHTDLADRMWVNDREIPGDGLDNDGNGYIDDVHGYDFCNNDPNIRENGIGHGTHVSGTVAGNGKGGTMTGVAPEARLMGCKVLDDWGYGSESDAWEGVQYAVDNGAHVIQGSIGWIHNLHNPDRSVWRELSDNVLAAGVIMSFAAGNERNWFAPPGEIRTPSDCPSPWRHPDQRLYGGRSAVVAVGATGYENDSYAPFSSKGPVSWEDISPFYDYPYNPDMGLIKPDVCAPGVKINSTIVGGGYSGETWGGTSMATPHNSGLIALMLSRNMAMLPEQIDSILQTTALQLGAQGKDNDYGSGRIRALAAVSATPELAGVSIGLNPADTVLYPGEDLVMAVTFSSSVPTPVTFDAWVTMENSWGGTVELYEPHTFTLAGMGARSMELKIPIPPDSPFDTYTVIGVVGGYPDQIMDRDLFDFRIGPIVQADR